MIALNIMDRPLRNQIASIKIINIYSKKNFRNEILKKLTLSMMYLIIFYLSMQNEQTNIDPLLPTPPPINQ